MTADEHRAELATVSDAIDRLSNRWTDLVDRLRDATPCPAWCRDHDSDGHSDEPGLTHQARIGEFESGSVDVGQVVDLRTGQASAAYIYVDPQDELTPEAAREFAALLCLAADVIDGPSSAH